jgi:hypothetical protein
LQAELQHTPSTQLPRAHSALVVHAAPTGRFGTLQLPALSHRLVALQTWPAARGVPVQSCPAEPQRPATQRLVFTAAGKSRHVVSAGHAIGPHAASSARFSHAVPDGAQRRHAPLHAAVQHTRPPPEAAWQLPAPQSASELHSSPASAKHPPRATLHPSTPHSRTVRHWPPVHRWKLEPEHCVASSSQTGASSQLPAALQSSLGAHASVQHTLLPVDATTQAPLPHSAPELQASSSPFLGREQLPSPSQSAVGLHSRSALAGWNAVHASAGVAQRPSRQRSVVTLGGS